MEFSSNPKDESSDLSFIKRIWILIKSIVFLEGNLKKELTDEEAEELLGFAEKNRGPMIDINKEGNLVQFLERPCSYWSKTISKEVTLLFDFETNSLVGVEIWGHNDKIETKNKDE